MDIAALGTALFEEARATNERRLIVLAGDQADGRRATREVLETLPIPVSETTLVGFDPFLHCEHLPTERTAELLGRTRETVVYDTHDALIPNAIGRISGAVDGGGLFVLLAPDLDSWPDRRDGFDGSLAVPPFEKEDVTGRYRKRLVSLLRAHRGIAIVNVDSGAIERDGLTWPAPRLRGDLPIPDEHAFPRAAYEACLTNDQVDAVRALESLRENGQAVVEADRGRGKSSAAGLAAGALAGDGEDVLVSAPAARNAAELFARARELLGDELELDEDYRLETASGGRVRYVRPPAIENEDPDVLIVDEAAALPVSVLERCLDVGRAAFVTTIHGYEGAGRGFSVRFRDRLEESNHEVHSITMVDPIRYAAGDPLEVWAFRALLLDARSPVSQLVEAADPDAVAYRQLSKSDLAGNEHLLREVFGLLVSAHYRTEPDDLARLLDAPNLAVRALTHEGHVISVALVAREGGLSSQIRRAGYEGERIRGNMIPDLLTSQLRDEDAGTPVGWRVLRIATHDTVRSRGLGSRLLSEVHREFAPEIDWLGVSYGATPKLLEFWFENGFSTVHLSTTKGDASGEYSAVMLSPTSEVGKKLHDRHAAWFAERIVGTLSDPLHEADPDVIRAVLRSVDTVVDPDLTEHDWTYVVNAAYGSGTFDTAPGSFRPLALAHLIDGDAPLTERQERLLVRKVLQGHPWDVVADELEFDSTRLCMLELGKSFKPLVREYGTETALCEKERYDE